MAHRFKPAVPHVVVRFFFFTSFNLRQILLMFSRSLLIDLWWSRWDFYFMCVVEVALFAFQQPNETFVGGNESNTSCCLFGFFLSVPIHVLQSSQQKTQILLDGSYRTLSMFEFHISTARFFFVRAVVQHTQKLFLVSSQHSHRKRKKKRSRFTFSFNFRNTQQSTIMPAKIKVRTVRISNQQLKIAQNFSLQKKRNAQNHEKCEEERRKRAIKSRKAMSSNNSHIFGCISRMNWAEAKTRASHHKFHKSKWARANFNFSSSSRCCCLYSVDGFFMLPSSDASSAKLHTSHKKRVLFEKFMQLDNFSVAAHTHDSLSLSSNVQIGSSISFQRIENFQHVHMTTD